MPSRPAAISPHSRYNRNPPRSLTPAVSQCVLFIGALIFYLVYQTRLRNTAVLLFPDREARLKTLHILNAVDENMTKYFGTFTVVNLCLGAATVLLTWAVGLPNPLLWGALTVTLGHAFADEKPDLPE